MSYPMPLYAGVSRPSVRRYPSAVKMTDNTEAQLTEVDSDQDVISRVMAGERDAFALLIGRYSDPLYRHALGMTGR